MIMLVMVIGIVVVVIMCVMIVVMPVPVIVLIMGLEMVMIPGIRSQMLAFMRNAFAAVRQRFVLDRLRGRIGAETFDDIALDVLAMPASACIAVARAPAMAGAVLALFLG